MRVMRFKRSHTIFFLVAVGPVLLALTFADTKWMLLVNRLLIIGILGFMALLMHRRHASDRELRQSESKLSAIVNNVIDGVISINERGIIESFNPACERIFGYRLDEVIGHNITMLMPEPYHSEHDWYLENYHKTGVAKIIGIGREVRGKRKDGDIFPMDLSVSAYMLEDGKHFSGVIRDISMRKRSEEVNSLLASIVESSMDAIISKNLQGMIVSWNKGAEHLFGYSADEAIGKSIGLIIPADHMEEEQFILSELKTGHTVEHFETRRLRKDGELVDISVTVSPIRDASGVIIGASKVARDISDRREAEKAHEQLRHAQKMEALGQLTGGIAHDFNNLLAVVLGNLDFLMEKTADDNPLREFIVPSIEAAEHGAELTKQLLAFSRKQALQPKIISLNELLNYFSAFVRHTLGERIEVVLALKSDLWNVYVDPSQLQNALLNLAVNARDAMPDGGKIIFETDNVSFDEEYVQDNLEAAPGDYAVIAVTDTGNGMSQQVMEKVFEPFFTTKGVGKGTGLGLSMVYGFVKQSKGHIKIYSEIGHGTSIKIYLPLAQGAAQSIKEVKPKPVVREAKAKLILIVEDNKNVLKLTSAIVESLGYSVLTCETGDAAIKILEDRSDIDLLLTDVMLPGVLNGPALAKRAAALYPDLRILFNSGYAEQAIIQSGILEDGVNLISKPFRKQQLADKLEEMLK